MYETLVDPSTLSEHRDDPEWVVIDCRNDLAAAGAGERAYVRAHIPGAFHTSLERVLTGKKSGRNGRHPLPEPERFARFLGQIGVGERTQVVAYDAGSDMYAARLWFLCRWVGHPAAAVLDGGYAAWSAGGYPVTAETSQAAQPGALRAPRICHEMALDAGEVMARLHSERQLVLDARSPDRFAGQNETIDPVAGHIPGARNRWYKENYDGRGRMKTAERLRAEFAAAGVEAPERVVHQCGSGISACVNLLAMEHAGLTASRLYAGSWSEWIADPTRPVARA
ncbi:MAG: sulfurtransferase [bacterium]|nr:sulfurtransferase [bacterium]